MAPEQQAIQAVADPLLPPLAIHALLCLLGLAAHFCKELIRIQRDTGAPPHAVRYWSKHPYQTALCVIGAAVGFLGLYEAQQLTSVTAFGCGWMANSMADVMGKRAGSSL